jgi:hypothetical protein
MRTRSRRALALLGTVAVVCAAITGCTTIDDVLGGGSGDVNRDEETGQVTESASIGIGTLEVGDCKLASPTGLIEDADVVPCDEPHDEEAYHEITMDDGDYSPEDINTAALECIGDAYTEFVGVPYEESAFDVSPITPSEQSWEELDDRSVMCLVFDSAAQTTGSLRGAGR